MIELHKNFKGVIGRVDFREDGKPFQRENERENLFEMGRKEKK